MTVETKCLNRITPACAGRRIVQIQVFQLLQDHPRVCGEKYSSKYSPWKTDGSPPRVRGEAENTVFEEPEARITPACAGRRIL